MLDTNDLVVWGHPELTVALTVGATGPVRVLAIGTASDVDRRLQSAGPLPNQPAVEIELAGEGRDSTGSRTTNTTVGNRLRYRSRRAWEQDGWLFLEIEQTDAQTGLSVTLRLSSPAQSAVIRAITRVTQDGAASVVLRAVSSWCLGGLLTTSEIDGGSSLTGATEWLTEGRWETTPLRPGALPDISIDAHGQDPRGRLSRTSRGGWSSGTTAPVAGLVCSERTWLWQVEHNGSWEWEISEEAAGALLAVSGPRDDAHGWSHELTQGHSFETVSMALAAGADLTAAAGALTAYRRALRAPHPDNERLPLIYNDYMNTLQGNPSTEALTPLIEAAAKVGAEVFCIDAGWYDNGGDWWDSVGEWTPSVTRFPGGLHAVLEQIRGLGLTPGLWLEPEVIGVRSGLAETLPDDAFFQSHGRRLREHGRFHLDLRHPAAMAHLDSVVDRLVSDLGVGYLKLDYNIDPGTGTDAGGQSAGAGLLGHNRAYLAWIDGLLVRYPDLILENCASGGLRSDYALLSRMQLQSTSDQQDPLRYPPIAVNAPLAMLPEQAASWAYPQPEMALEEVALTLATGLTGRFYLSGHIDRMDERRLSLVHEAVSIWRETRGWLATARPFWPTGLAGWDDTWTVAGLRYGDTVRLVITCRGSSPDAVEIPLPNLRGVPVLLHQVFPVSLPDWDCSWDAETGRLRVVTTTLPPGARVLQVQPVNSP